MNEVGACNLAPVLESQANRVVCGGTTRTAVRLVITRWHNVYAMTEALHRLLREGIAVKEKTVRHESSKGEIHTLRLIREIMFTI